MRARGRTGRGGRSAGLALLVALLALTVGASASRADNAPLGQFLWWSDDGSSGPRTFTGGSIVIDTGQITFLNTCLLLVGPDGVNDFFWPSADIYVVPAGTTDGAELEDVVGSPNTVTGIGGGIFISELIGVTATKYGGGIPSGTYDVVYDECQDGKYQASHDALFEDYVTVDVGADIPDWPSDAILEQKQMAEDLKVLLEEANEELEEMLDSAYAAASIGNPMVKFIRQLGTRSMIADPGAVTLLMMGNLAKHYEGISADPPDPSFDALTLLGARSQVEDLSGRPLQTAYAALATAGQLEERLAESLLRAMERYQGAANAGDERWALEQARATKRYAELLADAIASRGTAAGAVAGALAADDLDVDAAAAQLDAFADAVRANGFDEAAIRDARNLGLDAAEIDALENEIAARDYDGFTKTGLVSTLEDLETGAAAQAAAFDELADVMAPIVDFMHADAGVPEPAPVADAGGPYTGSVGSPVAFDASASSDPGSGPITAYEWDLDGDGAFDDATGATPSRTFTRPYEGLVAVRVSNANASAVDVAAVDVTTTNRRPAISASPESLDVAALVGDEETFVAQVTDADGDATTLQWRLDGSPIAGATADTYLYSPTPADVGVHVLEVEATDAPAAGGAARRSWIVTVEAEDADGDGWNANVDCVDDDPAIPGELELVGNGKDDDCDASTPDSGSAPVASFAFEVHPGLEVAFTDTSDDANGDIAGWAWDFGDGSTSSAQSPTHTYAAKGSKTVTLTVTDATGRSHTASRTFVVASPPVASFTYQPPSPVNGGEVDFTDTSVDADGTVAAWSWQFGDGGTSSLRHPTHVYLGPGTYEVTLTVTDDDGATGSVTQDVVVGTAAPGTAPAALFRPDVPGRDVAALANGGAVVSSSGWCCGGHEPYQMLDDVMSWPWATNGGAGTGQFAVIQVSTGAPRLIDNVQVQPRNDCCFDQRVRGFVVDVSTTGTANADFTQVLAATTADNGDLQTFALPAGTTAKYVRYRPLTNNGSCCYISTTRFRVNSSSAGARKVTFLNQSTNAVSYKWTFGDGGTSTAASPTHTYAARGTYAVTLVAKSADGRTATFTRSYEVRGPIADFTIENAPAQISEIVFLKDASSYVAPGTTFTWDFGDGRTSQTLGGGIQSAGTQIAYSVNGLYTITHSVTDAEGLTDSVSKEILIRDPLATDEPRARFYPSSFSSSVATSRGRDLALAPTGGAVHSYSSRFADYHPAETLIDGDPTNNWWATANGQTSGWVKIDLTGDAPRMIDRFAIQPRFFGQKVKDIEIAVSTTGTADSDFMSVARGPLMNNEDLQLVTIYPVLAKYVMYRALTNQGDSCCVSTNQVRAVTGQEATTATVAFRNVSRRATAYHWDFGDGTTSNEEHPTHTFPGPGTYTVTLTATGPGGTSTFTLEQVIRGAALAHTPAAPTHQEQIDFRDDSPAELGLVSWLWSFGDGTTSTQQHPLKTYAAAGDYTVTLTGTDRYGVTHVATKQLTVAPAAFKASFHPRGDLNVASLENGAAVLAYSSRWPDSAWWPEKLLDAYTNTAWHTASDNRSASIVFSLAGAGTYQVDRFQLLGRQDCCHDQHPRDFEIDVSTTGTADADFRTVLKATLPPGQTALQTFTLPRPVSVKYVRYRALTNRGSSVVTTAMLRLPSGQVNTPTVTYDDLTVGGVAPLSYAWDFGDGGTSTAASPTHTFAAPGTYDVTLLVTDGTGATSMHTLKQRILAAPAPAFTVSPAAPNEAQAATYADMTPAPPDGPIVERRWSWDDGTADATTTAASTTKTFADNGTYDVRLQVRDAWGQTAEMTKPVVVANVAPTVDAGPDWRWREDRELTTTVTTSDVAGSNDPVACTWTYGDGSASGTGCAFTHTYTDPGTYTATVTANDGDGGTATDAITVKVIAKEEPASSGGSGAAGGTGVGKTSRDYTYTLDADFELGTLLNVNHDAPGSDQLQLNKETKPFPFVYIANSARGTAVRIDVNTGVILGEYLTSPDGRSRNPSRTTVDKLGNVYVTNRDESEFRTIDGLATNWGSVTRVGLLVGGTRSNADGTANPLGEYVKAPFEYNTCVDRDGDGLIRTSRARGNILSWPNTGGVDHDGGAQTATDECIQFYTRVRGTNTRTVAIDSNNDAWIGGANNWHEKLDGDTGERVPGTAFNLGCGGYGGLIDRNDVLWSARYGNGLLRYDTRTGTGVCYGFDRGDYGLGVDPTTGEIWHSYLGGNQVVKLAPNGTRIAGYQHGYNDSQGVAVDSKGSVWVAHALFSGTTVGRVRTDGTFLGNASLGGGHGSTGVAVDANGKVWSANLNTNNATRIDPEIGHLVVTGDVPSGWFDLNVDLGPGAGPYNYSDMTGAVSLGAASPSGFWSLKQDATLPGTMWKDVSWHGSTPAGTSITIEVRAADAQTDLPSQPFVAVANGTPLSGVVGRFLEVRATLQTSDPTKTPILEDLRLSANSAPVASGASVETPKDTPKDITLGATDPDGDALTFAIVDQPTHGDVTLAGAVATYTPATGYAGADSFTFKANDGSGDSNVATISISVTATNEAPVAPDVAVSTPEDTPKTISLPATDPDGDALEVTYTQPAHGSYDGTTYTPAGDYHGPDSFTYTAEDPNNESDSGTVTITVTPVNDPPTAAGDAYSIDEDTALSIPAPGILANDGDVDGDALSVVAGTGPAHGSLTYGAGGAFAYTPNANFNGEDSFTYRASDGTAESALATVTITVKPLNDAPVVDDVAVATDEDTPLAISLTASDVDGDVPAITTTSPSHGTFAGGVYTPAANYNGPDAFTYTANDGKGGTDTATVSITVRPVNDLPDCAPASFDATAGVQLSGRVTCTDRDHATLAYSLVSGPAAGAFAFNPDGTFTYTSDPAFRGQAFFVFRARDAENGEDSAEATINVTAATDSTKPACALTNAGTDSLGRKYIEVTARDTGSGLKSIEVTKTTNATTPVPAFTVGSTAAVVVRGTKINQSLAAVIELRVTDVAGNITVCDPVLATITRKAGAKTTNRFTGLHQAESKVLLKNGRPGLQRVELLVNGRRFVLRNLKPGRNYSFDVAKAMKPGPVNVVSVIAHGRKGASATLVISD